MGDKLDSNADDLELSLLLFASLDQVEHHLTASEKAFQKGENQNPDPYLGILTPALFNAEDCNVYGHISATNVIVLVLVRASLCKQLRDEDNIMRSLLRQLHLHYVNAASNPFFQS